VESIYLDNNASTKIDERVFAAMQPYLTNHYAHPSSPHLLGTKVREKIEQARDSVAVLLGANHPDEIVFTSGGTESINTAIKGVLAASPTRNHIVTTKVEHISVLNVCLYEAAARRKTVNAKKEREILVVGLERLLRKESKIVEEYHSLAEMLESVPVSLLLNWVVIEEEAHHTILSNIIHSLKQTVQKGSETGADGVEMERDAMLFWIARLRMKELAVVADCRSLKSQACLENGDVVDAFLEAMIMDSEKHQRFLMAVEKAIENIMMSRPQ